MAETPLERYQRKVAETYVPTWEEYQGRNPESTYKQYLERFSAVAAQKQVQAGEMPSDYTGYSFTPMGYWAPSGSPATIGGLPSEIRDIFPTVQSTYSTALETGYSQSVIGQQEKPAEYGGEALNVGSAGGEPQISFKALPQTNTPQTSIGSGIGGSAPVQYNDVGALPQTGVGGIGAVSTWSNEMFTATAYQGNGNGNGNGGGLGLLALLAIALGAGL